MPQNILNELTESQLQAVTHKDGPMLVIAGAGSGKTRVVTRRLAWLLSQGVWPGQILAMTFTNKAAKEMQERVLQLTGQELKNIGTFHGICARFLRFDIEKGNYGRDSNFVIYDSSEQQAVMRDCLKANDISAKEFHPRTFLDIIAESKNRYISLEDAFNESDFSYNKNFLAVLKLYEQKLRLYNAFDFDDLLYYAVRLLKENPLLLELYQNRYRYILVDEYQDTNHLQYLLINLLCAKHRNIHATGDPDQSIYSWRGADFSNIMNFTNDFPDASIVKLEQNYRSTENILTVANSLIEHNRQRFDKQLFTDNETGIPVEAHELCDEKAEAEWICKKIRELRNKGASFKDIAILYRVNILARSIEEALVQKNIPYQILGGLRFYDRKEVKDFLALLRLKANPGDNMAFQRATAFLKTGVGPTIVERITRDSEAAGMPVLQFAAEKAPSMKYYKGQGVRAQQLLKFSQWCKELLQLKDDNLQKLLQKVYEHSAFEERLQEEYPEVIAKERIEHIDMLRGRLHDFIQENEEATLINFLADVALVSDVDSYVDKDEKLTLMTLHSAKGLEFPYVIIVGLEEDLLPHSNCIGCDEEIEEERRLFYVGITRARKALYMLYCSSRYLYGKRKYDIKPSEFLENLPKGKAYKIFEEMQKWRNFYKPKSAYRNTWNDDDDDDLPVIYTD